MLLDGYQKNIGVVVMNKTTRGFIIYKAISCFIIGLLIILFGIKLVSPLIMKDNNQSEERVMVEATVDHCMLWSEGKDIDGYKTENYKIMFSYEYEQKKYESSMFTTRKYDNEDKLEIYINPNNPQENYGFDSGNGSFIGALIFLVIGLYMLCKANTYRMAFSKNAKVNARVSKIGTENCEDTDGRTWLEHCVYVDYEYNGKKYKNIYWYGAETKNKFKSRLEKELSQFPKRGETFQIYINPKKPNEILSKAPFRIVN